MDTAVEELRGYKRDIKKITSAPVEILAILERIMRDEIFHSTLDWPTKSQFSAAARKANKMYLANTPFYDAQNTWHSARWNRTLSADALMKIKQTGSDKEISIATAKKLAADIDYEQAYLAMSKFF